MSAVLQQVDPTRGHNLVSARSQNREMTRYLFTPGQFLDPNRLFQLEHLRLSGGGEEVQSHCLRRSVGGFIQRGHLTPMEVWAEPMPPVLIGEGLENETVRIEGPATAEMMGMSARRPGALAGVGAAMVHVKFYPGDEIHSVLRANENKGIIEVKTLAGQPWYADEQETKPGVAQILNAQFFPVLPPPTLRGLREMIEARQDVSEVHSSVAREMLSACDQFLRWAETMLAVEHELLRTRRSHQHTYTYSPLGRELLKQLEMKPQDSILEQATSGINADQLREILGNINVGQQFDPSTIGAIAGEVARQFLAAQAAQQSAPQNKGGKPRKETDATSSHAPGSEG